ncbi:multisubunit sodium/proton antiporter MrpG subunit [Orenia metallireducens]|uniref:Multisubunit sodium/proton antiporter, MrpG subunit n=1 Tax=Orenia metallireducens TaxID=1413210 RepID=A0A285GSV0_9FIRM|nr:monovalent cation/H(+) antiporter subunit G [Orenia metallireducens]PRX32635.1 multisubunit sodium/proton antiporter MrpG subunit [Orenia metallireducens]SNY26619.1 multisubunit sodium/proton antiporter, MrpG subunit [Orenia metallireducens]
MINSISILREIIAYVFLITGTYFLISNAIGMIRFPDFYLRLHASSKCLIAGSISVLMGCIVLEGISYISLKLIIIIIFLLITNPVAIHAIAHFAYNYSIKPQKIVKNDIKQ